VIKSTITDQSPLYIKKEGAECIVIFIHGFAEGPEQFKNFLAITSEHGCSIATLLLPGHGGTGKEFAQTPRKEWQDFVDKEIEKYSKEYKRIILAGHSMGTLLSFLAYDRFSDNISGIIALNSPLYLLVKPMAIRNNLKIGFCKNLPDDDPAWGALRASSVKHCSTLTYISWAPRLLDLFALMRQTRKVLERINIPTLIVHADKDELISSKSVRVYGKKIKPEYRRIVRLPDSSHFICRGKDLEFLQREYADFIRQVKLKQKAE